MNRLEELRLVALCAIGDNREAFSRLVEAYQPALRRFLLHLTGGNLDLADDLAQEAFVKAWLNIRAFKGLANFKTWLFKIAYNEFYSECRRSSREVALDDEAATAAVSRLSADDPPPDTALTVEQLLSTLGDTERAAISLFYLQDMSVAKIAEVLDLPQGTVKSHLHRAKLKMAKAL